MELTATKHRAAAASPETGLPGGTLLIMAAEALAFPAGLAATILLTRYLPAADYGALALALAGIAWLEWTVVSLFSRAGWKLIAEANDWRRVATTVVRTFLLASLPVALIVCASADAVAAALDAPPLAGLLRVLAIEIPIFATAQAYRAILIGRGMHAARATAAVIRWTIRALLVAVGVLFGASLLTIAALIVAATVVELAVVRWRAVGSNSRARNIGVAGGSSRGDLTMRGLVVYAAPLALSAICMRLFDRIDIFALRALNGSLESVAAYGVAQNLALAPGLFGGALTPALIAALSYRRARGDSDGARQLGGQALRAGFLMLPLALIAAGAAPGLIDLMFGARYAAAAPVFALLIVGAVCAVLIALAGGVLVAAGQLRWTVAITAPLLLVALAGHLVLIPRLGGLGAAAVTAGASVLGAASACVAARLITQTPIPFGTLLRGLILGGAAGWLISVWSGRGLAVLLSIALITVVLAVAMCLAGELRVVERAWLAHWAGALRRPSESAGVP